MLTLQSIRTLFRTPLKTLLTILLLASTSYMLFFSVAEYAAMTREMARAVDFYQGTGAVEVEPVREYIPDGFWPASWTPLSQTPVYSTDIYLYADERVTYNPYGDEIYQNNYTALSRDDIEKIANLPYVTSTSVRYMTAGVSGTLFRAEDRNDFFSYTSRFVVEGTLENVGYYLREGAVSAPQRSEKGEYHWQRLTLLAMTAIAGNQQFMATYDGVRNAERYSIVTAYEFSADNDDGSVILLGSSRGSAISISSILHMGKSYYNSIYSYDYLRQITSGERYAVVGRGMALTDPATVNSHLQIYSLKNQPEDYLELDEFAQLRELVTITNDDAHTFDVVYTDDMSSIMRFAEGSMVVASGRMLSKSDDGKNVCVMSDVYMAQNGLKIGDRISLKLGDKLFEQNMAIGAIAYVPERYPDAFTEVEFEIVGAYRDVDTKAQQSKNVHWSYSVNTVFVPLSFLPVEVPDSHDVKPGEFSFVIGDPRDISAFMDEGRPIIEDGLGLTLIFTDGGWSELESQINRATTLSLTRLILLFFCTLVAVILTVYLFIGRKRKEYAIMRALGTPFSRANSSLYIPLACLAVFALAAGNVLGYMLIGDRIDNVLAPFAKAGLEIDASVPVYLIPVCFICVFAALAAVTAYMLRRIGKTPPIELLQMGTNRAVARAGALSGGNVPALENTASGTPRRAVIDTAVVKAAGKRYGAARHVASYVARHIGRTKVKSLFSFGLALLLIGAAGQLTVIRGVYQDSYDNLDVKAYVSGGLSLNDALSAGELEYVDNIYYENHIETLDFYDETPKLVMTNDIARFCGGDVEITFLDGYGYSSFATIDAQIGPTNKIVVMESGLMKALGVKLGDSIRFHSPALQSALILGLYNLLVLPEPGELLDEMKAAVDTDLDRLSVYFKLVGEVTSGCASGTAFIPVTRGITEVYAPDALSFNYAEFTMISPQYASDFKKFAESKLDGTIGDLGSPLVIDTSRADNILRTLGLLNTLYPIVIAAAVIMSGLFPGLAVMQSEREASIMRVLGTTKKRTRIMLVTEQTALCIAGQILALIALTTINGASVMHHAAALAIAAAAIFAGCLIGASICAVIITRRRVLELLQVKE